MTERLRIVMAQINLMVGDIHANTAAVIDAARQAIDAHQADVIVFPELTLTGYPPEDLLLRSSMSVRIEKALQRIQKERLEITLVVGHPQTEDGCLYNALSVIRGAELLARYHKQCLPNYQVFDEQRYFASGHSACVMDIKGVQVALTICEDMWYPKPMEQASQAGARLLININASPYHRNKQTQRLQLLRERAVQSGIPIVYVNLVGGQDELVFDGNSMVVDGEGKCRVLAEAFKHCLYPVDFDISQPDSPVLVSRSECAPLSLHESYYQALVSGLRDYVHKNGFRAVVLGLSGGIDSALTLAIAVDALGSDRVEAVMMPYEYTSSLSLELAEQQAKRLGVSYKVISIASCYESFMQALADEFAGLDADVTEQNIQARCRGVILMAISNKKGVLVLTTGNKSEVAVGYSTLYGDMAGGFNVLKDLYKTHVYELARYRNATARAAGEEEIVPQQVIERPPTAELAPGQLDQDNLPPYSVLDQILELYIENDQSADAIVAKGFAREDVHRVLRLVDLNEYKRRQSPVGVRLTEKGFGRDRRYPITNGWQIGE